jgi:hypothetical protein
VDCQTSLLKELVAAREKVGKSQRQVSELLGRAHNFCHFVETGERRLEVCEFIDYLNALGANASEIVGRLQAARR